MNYSKCFRIEPGSKVSLAKLDAGFHGPHASQEEAAAELRKHLERITTSQRTLYADKKHSLLIVLQGIDGAGKDGTCWHVIGAMDPQGVSVTGFKQPTDEERSHDFLWRVHPHAPGRGRVAIFNRSHYEDVLVVRVHGLVPKSVWKPRYDFINDWERLLVDENNTTVLKFFLNISKDEQLARFKERLDDPDHRWKISDSDYSERARWDDYIAAFDAALERCSTKHAPWFVIPSNQKWFRNLAVSSIIADELEAMKLQLPAPTVDIEEIRSLYHRAQAAEDGKKEKKGKGAEGALNTKSRAGAEPVKSSESRKSGRAAKNRESGKAAKRSKSGKAAKSSTKPKRTERAKAGTADWRNKARSSARSRPKATRKANG